jgi:hypothetical protein
MIRVRPKRRSLTMAMALAAAVVATLSLHTGAASAAGQVTISSSDPGNNQVVTVSGTGLPTHKQDPTGVQILECSDPAGSVGRLPTDASACDGSTLNPLPVNTDANGTFSIKYTFIALNNAHGTSNIQCDATHFCVLWVGVDYNHNFQGPHAFSTPFEIGGSGSPATSSSNALVIALPIAAVALALVALVLLRRRRAQTASSDPGRARAENPRA